MTALGARWRVLLADDDTALRRLISATLGEDNFVLLQAKAISNPATVREISASIIISVFAVLVSGNVSAGLSAVAPVKATNR